VATGGLYGNSNSAILSYFTWFVFQQASSQPSTPTGGSYNFQTNVGIPPSGWANSPAIPTTQVWMSMAIVSSQNSTITWSSPTPWSAVAGVFSYPAAGIPSSTGASWGTAYSTSGSGTVIPLATSPSIATPTFTGTITGSQTTGAITYGALTYSDVNNLATFQSSQNNYIQMVLQNSSNGTAASTNFNVSNNNATATTNFGEFGINSSGYSGTGSFSTAGYVYLASASTDLVVGTYGNNNIRFTVNSAATDVAIISSAGLVVNTGYAFSTPSIAGMTTPLSVGQGGTGVNASTGSGNVVLSGGATLTTATLSNATLTAPTVDSLNGGQLAGLRNRVINGNFGINQRGVSGTVTLAAGVYGHDRWKAGAGGCTYTFSTTLNVTTLTISAGTLQQVIEGANLESGSFILSFLGTATARIDSGSYGTSGASVTGTAVGGTNQTIEFGTGTVSKVQYERGTVATVFEQRPYGLELSLCQRYYQLFYLQLAGYVSGVISIGYYALLPVSMRATPTVTVTGSTNTNTTGATAVSINANTLSFGASGSAAGGYIAAANGNISAEL
jgi:hypothetical protein